MSPRRWSYTAHVEFHLVCRSVRKLPKQQHIQGAFGTFQHLTPMFHCKGGGSGGVCPSPDVCLWTLCWMTVPADVGSSVSGSWRTCPVVMCLLSRVCQMFQVVHSEKPLYVQAGNCVEASEWLEVLGQVSRCNEGRWDTFHPSNYRGGAWQCCKSQSSSAPGCNTCTT